mmetsp:Transcript_18513/g.38529  ORF Transcript_18513/g.38529 Transcript_18513/m.38529 type:complete len:309 (+) Transcript_18513:1638-2564(+)
MEDSSSEDELRGGGEFSDFLGSTISSSPTSCFSAAKKACPSCFSESSVVPISSTSSFGSLSTTAATFSSSLFSFTTSSLKRCPFSHLSIPILSASSLSASSSSSTSGSSPFVSPSFLSSSSSPSSSSSSMSLSLLKFKGCKSPPCFSSVVPSSPRNPKNSLVASSSLLMNSSFSLALNSHSTSCSALTSSTFPLPSSSFSSHCFSKASASTIACAFMSLSLSLNSQSTSPIGVLTALPRVNIFSTCFSIMNDISLCSASLSSKSQSMSFSAFSPVFNLLLNTLPTSFFAWILIISASSFFAFILLLKA